MGVVQAPAQEQGVFHAGKDSGPADELGFQRQHACRATGRWRMAFEVLGLLFFGQAPLALRQRQRQQEQACQLRGEGFGAGHANLTPARVM